MNLTLEILGVVLSLIYVVLMMRQNIWCWSFGILGSLLSIYIFIDAKLYSEVILYVFYVAVGIFGWVKWHTKDHSKKPVVRWKLFNHLIAIVIGFAGAFGLGYMFNTYTDADRSYFDASTTMFSFVASFMEAYKVLSGWIYWIVLNLATVFLYVSKDLYIYAGYSLVLAVLSVIGYMQWLNSYKEQIASNNYLDEIH